MRQDDEEFEGLTYDVEISGEENEYLKLPNFLTDFVKMDEEKIKIEIKTMAAQVRMSVK